MRALFIALALSAVAGATIAQPFYVGTWRTDSMNCVADQSDGGALRFSETMFWGTENECQLTNPTEIRGITGILFDMECSGEGMTDVSRLLLLQEEDGGLTMHRYGYTHTYERCE